MSEMPVAAWSPTMKLDAVIKRAADKLPGEAGQMLLQMVEPTALATMLGARTWRRTGR